MQRKVIQIADSTQLVSLPRKWCKKYNIKKGDEVTLTEKNNCLEVSTKKGIDIEKGFVDVTCANLILPRIIHVLYKKGYDEIEVRYNSPDQLKTIQQMFSTDVVGYEIVSQTKTTVIIKSVAGASESEFDTMLRRTFLVLESFSDGVYHMMKEKEYAAVDTLRVLESTNNRTTGFCRRILNKYGSKDYEYVTFIYCMVEDLEKVADEYKYLCDYVKDHPQALEKMNPEVLQLFADMHEFICGVHKLFYKYEFSRLIELFAIRKGIIRRANALYDVQGITARDTRFLHYVVSITQTLANILSFILEIKL